MSEQRGDRPPVPNEDLPVDLPPPVDPEAASDAPAEQVDDADRPVDDEEFWYPGEQQEGGVAGDRS